MDRSLRRPVKLAPGEIHISDAQYRAITDVLGSGWAEKIGMDVIVTTYLEDHGVASR